MIDGTSKPGGFQTKGSFNIVKRTSGKNLPPLVTEPTGENIPPLELKPTGENIFPLELEPTGKNIPPLELEPIKLNEIIHLFLKEPTTKGLIMNTKILRNPFNTLPFLTTQQKAELEALLRDPPKPEDVQPDIVI